MSVCLRGVGGEPILWNFFQVLSASFIHLSPGKLRGVSLDEKVVEARARSKLSGVIIKKSDGMTAQQIEELFYPTQQTQPTLVPTSEPVVPNNPSTNSQVREAKTLKIPTKSNNSIPINPNRANPSVPSSYPMRMTLKQLEDLICSPTKPQIRKVEVNKPASPKKVPSPLKEPSTMKENSTMKVTSPMVSIFMSPAKPTSSKPILFKVDVGGVRAAMHKGTPKALVCREKEMGEISTWLENHLFAGRPGSIFVTGPPGTGKTVTIDSLLAGKAAKYKSVVINCVQHCGDIFREVAKNLCHGCNPKTEEIAGKIIDEAVTSSKEMILLVLDEIDQLKSRDQTQAVLYRVFEWPALQGSKLALVGIANSPDLTTRVLPRLQVEEACKPTLIQFPPYNKEQLICILNARLQEGAGDGSAAVITPGAITFVASKISALSGDVRKALDVCDTALQLAQSAVRKPTLLKSNPTVSPRNGCKNDQPKIRQVDLQEITQVLNLVYGSKVMASLGSNREGLPVQQKILVASLLLMVKQGRTKEVTLGKLIDTYSKVLKRWNMKPELESSCVGMQD